MIFSLNWNMMLLMFLLELKIVKFSNCTLNTDYNIFDLNITNRTYCLDNNI